MESTDTGTTKTYSNKMSVRCIRMCAHLAWDERYGEYTDVSEYKILSFDVDPELGKLEYGLAPIPSNCYSKELAESMAKVPRRHTKQLDPSSIVDDLVLALLRDRGVDVMYIFD